MEGYYDEFGPIHPAVYQAAREIWPRAVNFGEFALHDRSLVSNLLMKAAANVSKLIFEGRNIEYLNAYLLKTFKRLVVEERDKTLSRAASFPEARKTVTDIVADLDRKILAREVFTHLNDDDRAVVLGWMLGYSHREIAVILGLKPATVRQRTHRAIALLRKTFENADT